MLTELFESAARIRALRHGLAGTQLDGFAQVLVHTQYTELTARRHLRSAEHIVYWADRRRIPLRDLTSQVLARFDRHLQHCRCPHFGHTFRVHVLRGARLFLNHLQETGIIASVPIQRAVPAPVLFVAFCQWMRDQRGTCESTLSNYGVHIIELLRRLGGDPNTFDARSLRQFVIEGSQACGWAAAKKRTTALRMFRRFLIAEGKCATGLEGAIPVLAHWRLSSLPRYLQAEEVERVVASCDLTTPGGRRDRAILLLLARLGLRAGDIVQLRLCDLDWKGA